MCWNLWRKVGNPFEERAARVRVRAPHTFILLSQAPLSPRLYETTNIAVVEKQHQKLVVVCNVASVVCSERHEHQRRVREGRRESR